MGWNSHFEMGWERGRETNHLSVSKWVLKVWGVWRIQAVWWLQRVWDEWGYKRYEGYEYLGRFLIPINNARNWSASYDILTISNNSDSMNKVLRWFGIHPNPKTNMTLLPTLCVSLSTLADLAYFKNFWASLNTHINEQFFKILPCWIQKLPFELVFFHFIWILHSGILPLFLPHKVLFKLSFFAKLQRHLYRYCGTKPTNKIMKHFNSAKSVQMTWKFAYILSRET